MISGWKSIATEIEKLTGKSCTVRTAYTYAARRENPLPVMLWNGRVVIERAILETWIAGQMQPFRNPPN